MPQAISYAGWDELTEGAERELTMGPLTRTDFVRFDHLICMDEENRESLLQMGAPSRKLSLLLEHDPAATLLEVPDPYYGGRDGFDTVFGLVDSACEALLQRLLGSSRRPDR